MSSQHRQRPEDREHYHRFYRSRAWRRCRQAYGSSVGWLCERCLAAGRHEPGVELHHIEPLTLETLHDPALTLGWDNLQLLCPACHRHIHKAAGDSVREGLAFDDQGQLVQIQGE